MKPSFEKYIPFKQINLPDRQWPNNTITKAPIWCSVDLRDAKSFGVEFYDACRPNGEHIPVV